MRRVGITGLAVVITMCISLVVAYAEATPARILLGKRELICSPSAVYDGKRVLAPLSVLEQLGAVCTVSNGGHSVAITSASGKTGEIALVDVGGVKMAPVDSITKIIGGEGAWDAEKNTLTLTAHVQSVEFVDGNLKVNCSFPVMASTRKWQDKLIVDLADARVATEAREVSVGGPTVARARLGQFSPDTSRVVLDLMQEADIALVGNQPAAQVVCIVGQNLPKPEDSTTKPQTQPTSKQSCKVNAVRLETLDETAFRVIMETTGKASVAADYGANPPEIALTLAGATLAEGAGQIDGTHPILKSARISQTTSGKKGVRVILSLSRIAIHEAEATDNCLTITVRLPDKAGGTLAGKTIVIDPGHGGREGGARWQSILEKDLNLRIAKELAAALTAAGANTVMTRAGDEVVGLGARPQVAMDRGADFFISLHCNSNNSPGSTNGIETYYHMQEPSPRALAYAVHAGVCGSTGMCDRRARSDRSLYSSGLKVLRCLSGSGVPGVLVECGYLNTASDRDRLVNADYRKKLAAGIVAGLKAYVEGEPIR